MARHTIEKHEGGRTFWSDDDGDDSRHQTVYKETYEAFSDTVKEVKGVHFDPETGKFHKK